MNIIHCVLGKANPDRMNGINKVVDSLANRQTEMGHDVSVWGITPSPHSVTPERKYKLKLFKAIRNKLTIDHAIASAIIQTPSHTVFHLHGGFIPEFYHISNLLERYQRKFVFTPHGNYASNAMKKNWFYKSIYFHLFERKILSTCKALQCLGTGEQKEISRLASIHHSVLIPNGQNLNEIHVPTYSNLKKEEPVFGYCGRVTRDQKGLDLLLMGFKQYVYELKGKGQLWIIGSGDYLEEMKELSHDLIMKNRIIFWGPQFGEEKFSLLTSMDAFYHTSRNEGLPMAILEAAACGVPCVVSEATNMSDYISTYQSGLVLPENTPWEIALSMQHIAWNKKENLTLSMGQRAKQMVKFEFNWETIASKLVDVYRK